MDELLELIATDIEKGGYFDWVAASNKNDYHYEDCDLASDIVAMAIRTFLVMTTEEQAIYLGRLAANDQL